MSSVDTAIERARDWVLSAAYPVSGTNYWVIRDHPLAPIRIYYGGRWYLAGGFYDRGYSEYYADIESVDPSTNTVRINYAFNLGGNPLILRLKVQNISRDIDRATIEVLGNYAGALDLYWGTTLLSSNPKNGDIYTVDVPFPCYYCHNTYGGRYVARHSTRIGAWLIKDLYPPGTTPYNIADAMERFMDDYGVIYDVYAPLWGKSNNYPDDFFERVTETWYGKGFDWLPWTDMVYPYKSRMYLHSCSVGMWNRAVLAKILRAYHLLNKYGPSQDVDNLITQALQDGNFDGYGFRTTRVDASPCLLPINVISSYRAYPTYLTASFLAFLIDYYKKTGNTNKWGLNLLETMDRLAGILVSLITDYCHNTEYGYLCFAHIKNGAPPAYRIGSITVYPSGWGDITEAMFWFLDLIGWFPTAPLDYIAFTNSESTILAAKALMLYRTLGRSPQLPTALIAHEDIPAYSGSVEKPLCAGDYAELSRDRKSIAFRVSPGCYVLQKITYKIHTLLNTSKIYVGLIGRVLGSGRISVKADIASGGIIVGSTNEKYVSVSNQEIDSALELTLNTLISPGQYDLVLTIKETNTGTTLFTSDRYITIKSITFT